MHFTVGVQKSCDASRKLCQSPCAMGKRKQTTGSGSAQKSPSGFDFATHPQIKLPMTSCAQHVHLQAASC